ncbi:TetR/AcrR family transcriptional regulator [Vallitalea guaymasensis]|uniref:TetR/AcrR family transcriptional regulator n=1 Tax=Vallitalea guaymasensis TaxID=1185412 RepID=UPI000DE1D0C7|nr:TetR/AcrR family transcriptional regulator [Vallitalea guaymasensis]
MDLKQNIIRTAYKLFAEKGYEKTTVSEIIESVGSSKGGFYHHFKSKDEVLEAITINYIKDLVRYYEKMQDKNVESTIESLNNVFITINKCKASKIEEWPEIGKIYSFKGNNTILRKMAEEFEIVTTELYNKLIIQGNEEGIFNVKYPEYLAGLWTRELIRIYGIIPQIIMSKDEQEYVEFTELLEFSEELINGALGFDTNKIKIKEEALSYVKYCRDQLSKQDN